MLRISRLFTSSSLKQSIPSHFNTCKLHRSTLPSFQTLFSISKPSYPNQHQQISHFTSTTLSQTQETPPTTPTSTYLSRLKATFILSNDSEPNPKIPTDVILRSGLASFFGIGCLTGLHYGISNTDLTMVLGSFGATAVLVYGYPGAPFSQPKNVVVGHVLSAGFGVLASKFITPSLGVMVAAPTAISLSTMGMMVLGVVHPPAGGTCLIACLGSEAISQLGFYFLVPTGFGSMFLVSTAWLINNLSQAPARKYPTNGWLG